jgi:hypothetical protein
MSRARSWPLARGGRRARRFADALARARARLDLPVTAPGMTLLLAGTGMRTVSLAHHSHHTWIPQLRLGLAFGHRPGPAGPAGVPPLPPELGAFSPGPGLERLRVQRLEIERLFARTVRSETVRDDRTRPAAPAGAGALRAPDPDPARPAAPAVPRVLARAPRLESAGPRALETPAPAGTRPAGAPFATPPFGAAPEAAAPRPKLGPAELDRITEHVLHQVGRRINAYNERRGR